MEKARRTGLQAEEGAALVHTACIALDVREGIVGSVSVKDKVDDPLMQEVRDGLDESGRQSGGAG